MFSMARLKNHPCDLARSLAVEILVTSVPRYCHMNRCKRTAMFWHTLGESLGIEALTMK